MAAADFTTLNRSDAPEPDSVQQRIKDFQEISNLKITGTLDEDTQNKIYDTLKNQTLDKQPNPIKIKNITNAGNGLQDLISLIAALENSRTADPLAFEGQKEANLDALKSIHDILQFTVTGKIINTSDNQPPPKAYNPQNDERFFKDTAVYDALNSSNPDDALEALYNHHADPNNDENNRGILVSRDYPSSVAALGNEAKDKFEKQLLKAGFAPKDATRAIISGAVTPHLKDLEIIYKSATVGTENRIKMAEYALKVNPDYANQLARFGSFGKTIENAVENEGADITDFYSEKEIIKAISEMPDWEIGGAINQYRAHVFNTNYGDLNSAIGVNIYANEKPKQFGKEDFSHSSARHLNNIFSFMNGYQKDAYEGIRNEKFAGQKAVLKITVPEPKEAPEPTENQRPTRDLGFDTVGSPAGP